MTVLGKAIGREERVAVCRSKTFDPYEVPRKMNLLCVSIKAVTKMPELKVILK